LYRCLELAVALALFEGETHGKNIYGHDVGGALSTRDNSVTVCGVTYPKGSNIPVTPANAAVFLIMVAAGHKSNGMGPGQVTYAADLPDGKSLGYFRQMLERDMLPWKPLHNMQFCLEKIMELYNQSHDWALAGGHYNGGTKPDMVYGNAFKKRIDTWNQRV
jgi:hypothetical protein